jgi:ribonuclease HI
MGLQAALKLGVRQLEVIGDSMLVVKQISLSWRVRKIHLLPYFNTAR